MKQEWMLDLLTDIRECALNSGMFALAEHLEDSIMIAASEIKGPSDDGALVTEFFGAPDRRLFERSSDGDHA